MPRWKSKIPPISLPCWPATSSRRRGQLDDAVGDRRARAARSPPGPASASTCRLGMTQVLGVQHDGRADHHAGGNADAFLDLHRVECCKLRVVELQIESAVSSLHPATRHSQLLHSFFSELALEQLGQLRRRPASASSPSASMRSGVPSVAARMIICMTLLPSASPGSSPPLCTVIVDCELVGHVHELHRRPRVQPELVADDDVSGGGGHGAVVARVASCRCQETSSSR